MLAADSRMTYSNPKGWPKVASDYVYKVFELSERAIASTFGWAFLNGQNMNSLTERFKGEHDTDMRIEELASVYAAFFQRQYEEHIAAKHDKPVKEPQHAFGFMVAGYDAGGVEGEIWECLIPGPRCRRRLGTASNPGAAWHGQIDIISRLIKGVDPRLDRKKLPAEAAKELGGLEYRTAFPQMTLQDAIDYAIFLVRATIEMQRFSDGIQAAPGDVAGTGGPIDIALATPSGVRWLQRKQLRAELEGAPQGPEPFTSPRRQMRT